MGSKYCSGSCVLCTMAVIVGISCFMYLLFQSMYIARIGINTYSCPLRISTNISITPCNYDEMNGAKLQANRMVQLPNDYFLKVVVRRGTPSLCVFHRSSTNTSITLQLITSVKKSPLCSPEQMMDCLPSSHVSFQDADYFGVSVWDQQSSSIHYLIVTESTLITFQRNFTNAHINLQDLWYNAINCDVHEKAGNIVFLALGIVLSCIFNCLSSVCNMMVWYREGRRHPYKRLTETVIVEMEAASSRTSSISAISAKPEQGHQCQSELVGYHTRQWCSDSPTLGSSMLDCNSPSRMSCKSHCSVRSEQERDRGELALHTNPLSAMKRSSSSPKVSTVLWPHQQQKLLQDIQERVILKVAAEWEILAIHLGVETAYINVIKRNNKSSSCIDACFELFCGWIEKEMGTGGVPRTWESVVQAIRKMGAKGLADELNKK